MSKLKKQKSSKYWICKDCAKKKNWMFPDYSVTCINGFCAHCDRNDKATLIPVVDFNGPNKRAVWD